MHEDIYNDLAKISKRLMLKEPFYGMLLISLEKTITTRVPIAGVRLKGINVELTINPVEWPKLDDLAKLAVLKHELLHIAFFHISEGAYYLQDRWLANLACDLEVNQYIEDEYKSDKFNGIELKDYPELNLPEFAGFREYFRILQEVNKQRDRPDAGKEPLNNLSSHLNDPDDGSSPEKSKLWTTYDALKRGEQIFCSHEEWDSFLDTLDEATRKLMEKQMKHQLKDIADHLRGKGRGLIPSELESIIDGLYVEEPPVIDWKEYLRRFAGSSDKIYTKKTRRKLNKRFHDNPGLKIKTKKHVLIGMDTSGSVGDEDILDFFSEIYHIWRTGVKITIAECDADIANVYEYKGEMPKSVKGRGGTDFQPVIDYYNTNYKKYNTLIYLTDGYCSPPTSPAPRTSMLWVISSGGIETEGLPGKTVKIQRQKTNEQK